MNFNSNNISVVMATFNGARYLDEQLQSIVEQTILPEELIICDDGSSDNTIQIIQNYEKILPIKLIINVLRLGVAANFKKAAALAKQGNYIAFADQDDIWNLDKLASHVTLINGLL